MYNNMQGVYIMYREGETKHTLRLHLKECHGGHPPSVCHSILVALPCILCKAVHQKQHCYIIVGLGQILFGSTQSQTENNFQRGVL